MYKSKNPWFGGVVVLVGIVAFLSIFWIENQAAAKDTSYTTQKNLSKVEMISKTSLLSQNPPSSPKDSARESKVEKRIKVIATAYSSTVHQTDSNPFITASGERVEWGIVANNLFPFGTRVRFPEAYGGQVFTVKDRMHSEKGYYQVDIWFPSTQKARQFGSRIVTMEVLAN